MKTYVDGLKDSAGICQQCIDRLAKDASAHRVDSVDHYGVKIEMQAVKTVMREISAKVREEERAIEDDDDDYSWYDDGDEVAFQEVYSRGYDHRIRTGRGQRHFKARCHRKGTQGDQYLEPGCRNRKH